ncbi:ATP-binding protein [Lentzea sp. NPDC004782]|uniref:ATP-binding protein n=1 Tax=Lentzea sp. NPDC004782 TaxID=3154458 RepID=UPI0033AED5E6
MKFTVSPRLLDHFGVAMYNTVTKAIAELCANAYDADAKIVKINYTDSQIVISDDGLGMTTSDMKEKYLHLGRDRRGDESENGELTQSGRAVIGNKGIGKLAGFGIVQTMTIETWKSGEKTRLTLDRDALDTVEELESFDLQPTVTKVRSKTSSGTTITLSDFLEEVKRPEDEVLRAYLARHLPARHDWQIFVNGVKCSPGSIPGKKLGSMTSSKDTAGCVGTTSLRTIGAVWNPALASEFEIVLFRTPAYSA